jgi:hypothetical protein
MTLATARITAGGTDPSASAGVHGWLGTHSLPQPRQRNNG